MYMQHCVVLKCGFKQASAKSNHIKCSGAGNLILQKKSMEIPSKLHEFINKRIQMCSCNIKGPDHRQPHMESPLSQVQNEHLCHLNVKIKGSQLPNSKNKVIQIPKQRGRTMQFLSCHIQKIRLSKYLNNKKGKQDSL